MYVGGDSLPAYLR
jgi:hypothetical protein